MSYRILPLSLALLFAATGFAQSGKVVPVGLAAKEGNSSSAFPFGYTRGRTQQIWAPGAITSKVAILNGVEFRVDGGTRTLSSVAYTKVTLSAGVTSVSPERMSTTFKSNLTGTMTVLMSGKFNLPAQTKPSNPPAAFNIKFSWTKSYLYDSKKGNLIMDWVIPGSLGKQSYFVDAERTAANTQSGSVASFGSFGAFSSKETITFSANPSTLRPGGTLDIFASSFSKSYPAGLILGVSNTTYLGLTLPYDLKNIGMTGNKLYVSMDLINPFPMSVQNGRRSARFAVSIPNNPYFLGWTLYAQSYYADPGANTAGIVASNGLVLKTAASKATQQLGYHDTTSATGWLLGTNGSTAGAVVRFVGVIP